MKSFIALIFVSVFCSGVLCGRLRRQASVPAGAPGDITTQGSDTRANDMASGIKVMDGDLKNQESAGTPIKQNKISSMLGMAMGVGKTAGEISNPNKDSISNLMSPPKNMYPGA